MTRSPNNPITQLPDNAGSLDRSDPAVGTGMVEAPEHATIIKIQIRVAAGSGMVEEARFKAFGCVASIAAGSVTAKWAEGRTLEEALHVQDLHMVSELNLPAEKTYCASLAAGALRAAVMDYQARNSPVE